MFIDKYLKLLKILHQHVFLEIRNDSDCVIDDDSTLVKIISSLKSSSNI